MVSAFFRSAPTGLDHIVTQAVGMLGDARHSFDQATSALLLGTDPAIVESDILETDRRINTTEQELRSELVVHVTVSVSDVDIGSVLGLTLLLKKIERIGDQAKNVLDLATAGATLTGEADIAELRDQRDYVSRLFVVAGELLSEPDEDGMNDYARRVLKMTGDLDDKIAVLLKSEEPGFKVVPRAIYFRYLKRILANLLGVVSTSNEPLPNIDYLDDGTTDVTDD
jgi:hypothetical protein